MTALDALLARLDACAWSLDGDERVPDHQLQQLAEDARTMAPTLPRQDLVRLALALDRVHRSLAAGCRRIDHRLEESAVGRRAIRAYTAAK